MTETLPRFERSDHSPRMSEEGSAILLSTSIGKTPAETVVRGSWRIAATERAELGAGAVRPRVWLLAIARESRLIWIGRPGGDAILFGDDEPASGAIEGWFHVSLGECLRMPDAARGLFDLVAVLGPWKSPSIEALLK